MGFNLGNAVSDISTGGLSAVYRSLRPSQQTATNVPMETPEQQAARKALLDFTRTGKLGTYDAGAAYTGALGDFSPTSLENSGMGQLSSLLTSGNSPIFSAGQQTLQQLLGGDTFDPLASGGVYQPFKDQVQRNINLATGDLKNKAAFSGNLYSTSTNKSIGQLEQQGQAQLTSKLGDLYQNYVQQKLSGIPMAAQYATTAQNLALNPIEAAFNYGGLNRNLATAGDQAGYQEFIRQQQAKSGQVNAAGTVANANVPYGVPSATVPIQSPWLDLLKTGIQAGSYLAAA